MSDQKELKGVKSITSFKIASKLLTAEATGWPAIIAVSAIAFGVMAGLVLLS